MRLGFVTVDVFTDRKFGGNPVAVIPDARGLDGTQMQSIAAEFNLSETTFVLPPEDSAHTAHVRIFTPRAELPFAGHPNVGTAYALARSGAAEPPIVFEEAAGLVAIELMFERGGIIGARLAAPQRLSVGQALTPEAVAEACAIDADTIETARHPPCVISTGTPFLTAELKSRAALAVAGPVTEAFERHVPLELAAGIQLYTTDGSAADIECRVFVPLQGVTEDPATGSANVNLIALIAYLGLDSDLTLTRTISQGVDMGRPSLLAAEAVKEAGTVMSARIGGTCVPMMQGTLEI